MTREIIIQDEQAMLDFGARLARVVTPGMVMYLHGELGAGKTMLCRGFLRALGHESSVKSPTYTLVEPYQLAGKQLYHFDLYRLRDPRELHFMGIDDYFSKEAICLIEWPEQGHGFLPEADVSCEICVTEKQRLIVLSGHTAAGKQALSQLVC